MEDEIKLPYKTRSLCPECLKVLNAEVYEENGKVMIRKVCPEHGEFVDVYWGDVELFKKASRFRHDGLGIWNPITKNENGCPFSCGLCNMHKSHTALLNIVLTNRCDLACWYCLPADEVAVFKIDGRIEVKSFGEIAEGLDFKHKVRVGEIEGEFSVPDSLEVLTFKDGKVCWTKVTKFLRRKFEGHILRVKTKTGREIRLTPEHNVFVYRDGKLVKKRADELRREDKLVLLWRLPVENEVSEINIIEGFTSLPEDEKRKTFVHGVRHVIRPSGRYNHGISKLGSRYGSRIGSIGVRRNVRIRRIGDFYVDEISEISSEYYSGYVYDLEVEADMHAFVAGDGVLISNCFFYAKKAGYVYEPTLDQIIQMVRTAKNLKPVGCNAVQLTGGEPTLRDDLIDIIKAIKAEGIDHIQLNTNGIRLALEKDFALKVREAGVNTVYLSFDGVDEKTNPKNIKEIPAILENCRRAELGLVLVPTVIRTVNDHQLGDIIRFAADNIDIIRGVNIQPVSLVGSMPRKEREKYRITIPDVIKRIEEQTNGEIAREDFYPVPCVTPISHFVEALTGRPQYEFTCHFACGMATYVFKENGKLIPITRFIDVEGFFEYLDEKAEELKSSKIKSLKVLKSILDLRKFVDSKNAPKSLDVSRILFDVLVRHDYTTLGEFHARTLFIGMMHFQDLYNYDIERVKRCVIHYGTPDGRIIPFCAFNVLPEIYRDKIHEQFGIPIEEWEKKTGRRLKDEIYRVVRRPKD